MAGSYRVGAEWGKGPKRKGVPIRDSTKKKVERKGSYENLHITKTTRAALTKIKRLMI